MSIDPTILRRPNIALKSSYIGRRNLNIPQLSSTLPQSASLLHINYGRFLDQKSACEDVFYALNELFNFVASSELQFLNMIEVMVTIEMEKAVASEELGDPGDSHYHSSTLSNLVHAKNILDKHINRLKANAITVRDGGSRKWRHVVYFKGKPSEQPQKQADIACSAQNALQTDFEHLLAKAQRLSESCDHGISVAGKNAMVAKARLAHRQAQTISRLTLLAFFFILASFTTSLFGVNFRQFSTGSELSIQWWFVLLLPTYVVSFLVLYYDFMTPIRKIYRSEFARLRRAGQRYF